MSAGATETAWQRALGALGPLDRARAALLSVVAPLGGRALFRDRGLRVAAGASFAVALAFAVAWFFPLALLALGPIALGVPHLLADVRYLIMKPAFHRRAAFWFCVIAPLGLVYSFPRVWVGLVASLGAIAMARTGVARKIGAALAVLALAAFAYRHVGTAELVLAHAHNVIALLVWTLFFRGPSTSVIGKWRHAIVIALFAGATAVIFFAPLPWPASFGATTIDDQTRILAPLRNWDLAARLVVFFAFAQSVHYAVWLRAVPDEARPREGVRGFVSSARALRADVGLFVIVVFALLALGIAVWALTDLVHARTGYLRLATAHGYLELAVAALFLLERPADM